MTAVRPAPPVAAAAPRPPHPALKYVAAGVMWGTSAQDQNVVGYMKKADGQHGHDVVARVGEREGSGPAMDPKHAKEYSAFRQAVEAVDFASLPEPGKMEPGAPWTALVVKKNASSGPQVVVYPAAQTPQSILDARTAAEVLAAKVLQA